MIEDQWEEWTHLSQRQLARPLTASHVNITVFAANPTENSRPTAAVPRTDTLAIPVPAEPIVRRACQIEVQQKHRGTTQEQRSP